MLLQLVDILNTLFKYSSGSRQFYCWNSEPLAKSCAKFIREYL